MNVSKQRRGRPMRYEQQAPSKPGSRQSATQPPADRKMSGRGKAAAVERPLIAEEVYSNKRLTSFTTSILGCVVQVQTKNKEIYEGILRTFSPKMDLCVEMVHKVEENSNGVQSLPSKDLVIDSMIFHLADVVTLTALNVDLDYARNDTFTDSAISGKLNGQMGEKELQPWVADSQSDGITLESVDLGSLGKIDSSANGWDPNDMFKVNKALYNVQSSYDPSLSQYTIPLKQENTKEYKEREAMAMKLAHEIEKSDGYKSRIDVENGDGDGDEEDKFSAVVRPNEQGQTGNKYVPPHLRKTPQQGRAVRPHQGSNTKPSNQSPQPSPTQRNAPDVELKVNGDNEKSVDDENRIKNAAENEASNSSEVEANASVKNDRKSSNPKARDEQIKELKEFSTNFRLTDNEKEKHISPQPTQHALASPASGSSQEAVSPTQASMSPQRSSPAASNPLEDKKNEIKLSQTLKNSTLNPHAKEFVLNPNAKPFKPQQPMPVATPPRPATQSPVMVQQGMPTTIHGPPLYQSYQVVPVSMAAMSSVQAGQRQPFDHRKRAVVSVQPPRPDFNQAQAAAAAATGQPLLAQPTAIQQTPQYTVLNPCSYNMNPAALGQPGTMPQMMPMPPASMAGTRMIAPGGQQHLEQGVQQQGQGAIFVNPPGTGSASHMGPPPGGAGQPHPHQTPAHMAPHHHQHQPTTPHTQPSHMNSQQAGAHPAPSPVQHHVGPGHPASQQAQQQAHGHPGPGHQPTSATPQQQLFYSATAMMAQQHPPLQPSPHTPTSPQTMYPPTFMPSFYTNQAAQGQHQQQAVMSINATPPHTTVTHAHAQHQQHSHIPQQLVMMHQSQHPQASAMGQIPHQQQLAHTLQHMPGMHGGQPGHLIPQTMTVSSANMPHQMHYQMHPHHQMQAQGHPPPGQAYQHNQ